MLTVIYERYGCEDIRFFRSTEEFDDWHTRQMEINPETRIISIEEDKQG